MQPAVCTFLEWALARAQIIRKAVSQSGDEFLACLRAGTDPKVPSAQRITNDGRITDRHDVFS
jgi:hypothetical protein